MNYYFIFCKDGLLLKRNADGTNSIPLLDNPPTELKPWTQKLHIGQLDGHDVTAYYIDSPIAEDSNYEMCTLRQSYYRLPEAHYIMAGKCSELLFWDSNNRYCGVCGGTMKFHTDISKKCEQCGREIWPSPSPAVIVLIHRGDDEVLLARGRSFRSDFYGLIAGFVETGETFEEAVAREVKEETGLSIKNLRYFDSQPWPYPLGIMVGYYAEYAGGEIHMQREELKEVAWFHRNNLPKLPEKLSIARRLIDNWVNNPEGSSKDCR